jgi:hypothetical protein
MWMQRMVATVYPMRVHCKGTSTFEGIEPHSSTGDHAHRIGWRKHGILGQTVGESSVQAQLVERLDPDSVLAGIGLEDGIKAGLRRDLSQGACRCPVRNS